MQQLELCGVPAAPAIPRPLPMPSPRLLARHGDPGTSHGAAAGAARRHWPHYERILAVMEEARPLGAEQIAARCGIAAYAVRKRLPELQREKLVALHPGERLTSYGRAERLWVKT